jgi:hypothetical protein
VLCADAGVPAWSAADAWAYSLHGMLREAAFDARLVHLLTEADVWFFRHFVGDDCENQGRLDGVVRCVIDEPLVQRQAALADLIDAFAPELLVAWGTIPARLLKRAAPQIPLVLMVDECAQLEELIECGAARDFLDFRAGVERGVLYPRGDAGPELDALAGCDLAVSPSELARFTHDSLYSGQRGKMYARSITPAALAAREAAPFATLRRPFAQRDIDVLFIAGRWDAAARNLGLAGTIGARFPSREIHLVGECSASPAVHTHGVVARPALFDLLGRAKVAVFPGLADPAPGGMFEAAAMGCNVVASANCGFWELCHEDLRIAAPSAAAFLDRIELACSRPFGAHGDQFLGDSAELIEILAVF